MVKEKIDLWLDRLEELFPWTAENEEVPNRKYLFFFIKTTESKKF